MLMSAEESRWVHQVQVLSGPRHGDVQETALFLDLLVIPGSHIRWDTAIRDVEHEHRIPFLALRGVNSRQHEVVLIEMRLTRFGAGGLGRIQGELGQEGAARCITPGNLLQLIEIGRTRTNIVVQALEVLGVDTVSPRRSAASAFRQKAEPIHFPHHGTD